MAKPKTNTTAPMYSLVWGYPEPFELVCESPVANIWNSWKLIHGFGICKILDLS